MKKRIVSLVTVIIMLASMGQASASVLRASDYFDSCIMGLNAIGNGNIRVTYGVFGTDTMLQIGAKSITIQEQSIDGSWEDYRSIGSSYTYNDMDHFTDFTFGGSPGESYRVVIQAYAKNSSGSETKTYTSESTTCR